ncbi:MAG TPA: PucR family transcriptional regulator [Clostridiales bacterium]|jgi:carbohydrate diacid regulator|nr:PucR family transcriptional regulator [Clostridiales bacterium]
MSGRVFQSVIVQMKEATDRAIGVIDSEGSVIACSELSLIGTKLDEVSAVLEEKTEQVAVSGGRTFKYLSGWDNSYEYVVFVDGEDNQARCICIMASIAFNEAKACHEEKYDKTTFIKNILLDNILPGDIFVRARELRFDMDVSRAVFLIRQLEKSDISAVEVIQNLYPDRDRDFIVSVSETDIVLVKEVPADIELEQLHKIAMHIENTISTELFIRTVIGIGSVAKHLRLLAEKYKEAQVAIEVGKVFDTEKTIISYENLGIGRIIYQLPTTLCEMFLSEVFKKNPIDSLDHETLYTIRKFFENNLNVSETSRKLFVHRNTLVYRLEKIKKLTGLDLREFDHAIVFKVALMVNKYLNSQGVK